MAAAKKDDAPIPVAAELDVPDDAPTPEPAAPAGSYIAQFKARRASK